MREPAKPKTYANDPAVGLVLRLLAYGLDKIPPEASMWFLSVMTYFLFRDYYCPKRNHLEALGQFQG